MVQSSRNFILESEMPCVCTPIGVGKYFVLIVLQEVLFFYQRLHHGYKQTVEAAVPLNGLPK